LRRRLFLLAVSEELADPVLPGDEDAWRVLVVPIGALQVRAPVVQARAGFGSMMPHGAGRIAVGGYSGDEMGGVVQGGYVLVHGISCGC